MSDPPAAPPASVQDVVSFMSIFAAQIFSAESATPAMEAALEKMGGPWADCKALLPALLPFSGQPKKESKKSQRAEAKEKAKQEGHVKPPRNWTTANIFTAVLMDYAHRNPEHDAFQKQLFRDEAGEVVMTDKGKPKEVRGGSMIMSSGCWKEMTEQDKEGFKTTVGPFLENFNQLQHVAGFVKPDNIMPLLHDYLKEAGISMELLDKMLKSAADSYARKLALTAAAAVPLDNGAGSSQPAAAPAPAAAAQHAAAPASATKSAAAPAAAPASAAKAAAPAGSAKAHEDKKRKKNAVPEPVQPVQPVQPSKDSDSSGSDSDEEDSPAPAPAPAPAPKPVEKLKSSEKKEKKKDKKDKEKKKDKKQKTQQ